MRTARDIAEVLYHAICIAFVSVMCFTLATYRPIEPNVFIAGVEIVMGSCAVVYGGISVARIVRDGGKDRMSPEIRKRFLLQGQYISWNQCTSCKRIRPCPFEIFSSGSWQPLCRECKREAQSP